jgi:hypothetical protein
MILTRPQCRPAAKSPKFPDLSPVQNPVFRPGRSSVYLRVVAQQQARQIDRCGLLFRLFGLAIEERGAKLGNGRFQPGDLGPEFLNGCIKLARALSICSLGRSCRSRSSRQRVISSIRLHPIAILPLGGGSLAATELPS